MAMAGWCVPGCAGASRACCSMACIQLRRRPLPVCHVHCQCVTSLLVCHVLTSRSRPVPSRSRPATRTGGCAGGSFCFAATRPLAAPSAAPRPLVTSFGRVPLSRPLVASPCHVLWSRPLAVPVLCVAPRGRRRQLSGLGQARAGGGAARPLPHEVARRPGGRGGCIERAELARPRGEGAEPARPRGEGAEPDGPRGEGACGRDGFWGARPRGPRLSVGWCKVPTDRDKGTRGTGGCGIGK